MNKYIQNKIKKIFAARGIDIVLGKIRVISLNKLNIKQVVFASAQLKSQFLQIDIITLHISVWKSLLTFALTGEIRVLDIHGEIACVSEKSFTIESILITFKIRFRTKLFFVEIDVIPIFIQIVNKRHQAELYLESKDIVWNNIIKLLYDHLQSDLLKNACSESKISVFCYLKKMKNGKNNIPIFTGNIKSDGFVLFDKNFPFEKEKAIWIDNIFLKNIFTKKISKDKSRNYISFSQISKNLINAVICTEDPDFWNHHGISPFYVGYALQENVEKKKISRGASTITMQLVRNLFLSHNRTFARKAEESIIALLLENYYKISKETILELYLNILEFAPNVYGIDEASTYYFSKNHSELSLTEILTLTYIIPRPKYFGEALRDKTQQLKENLYQHIKAYSATMLTKKLIPQEDWVNIYYSIQFAPIFDILDCTLIE